MPAETKPNPLLQLLKQQLEAAQASNEQVRARNEHGTPMQIPGTGKALTSAYEQLRNAAEYTEEHLLLQRAIRRFYRRNLSFSTHRTIGNLAEELIVELTQAGYLHSKAISLETSNTILHLINHSMDNFWLMRQHHISREEAMEWTLENLSVETESMLNPHAQLGALAQVGYQYFLQLLPREPFLAEAEDHATFELALYIAVHQALLKSDLAVIRHDLTRLYRQSPEQLAAYVEFNRTVTSVYTAKLTGRLKRAVSKHAAPLRILKAMIDDGADLPHLLTDHERFITAFDQQVRKEYRNVTSRLNKGIIKSIIFIFITKIIIGVGVEVPYDLLAHGAVAILPLAINLGFPPIYMALFRLGLKPPTTANAHALHQAIDKILYSDEPVQQPLIRSATRRVSLGGKVLYGLLFTIPLALTTYILMLLGFNIVQGIIFFVFLSTASFLGFRLGRMIRELEIVTKQSGFLASMGDFFYLPFILVGQWLSSKYAKVNAVAYVLDIAIELPLKTALRLLRQWTRFLNEKHEEIY